jgi:hypothetical protein
MGVLASVVGFPLTLELASQSTGELLDELQNVLLVQRRHLHVFHKGEELLPARPGPCADELRVVVTAPPWLSVRRPARSRPRAQGPFVSIQTNSPLGPFHVDLRAARCDTVLDLRRTLETFFLPAAVAGVIRVNGQSAPPHARLTPPDPSAARGSSSATPSPRPAPSSRSHPPRMKTRADKRRRLASARSRTLTRALGLRKTFGVGGWGGGAWLGRF